MADTGTLEDALPNFRPGRRWVWAFHVVVAGVAAVLLLSWSFITSGD
jgi:hypothetical protein